MPTVVARVVQDDGTEQTYGPVTVSTGEANNIVKALQPLAAVTQEQQDAALLAQIEADTAARNEQAAAAQAERERLAAEGTDPDADTPAPVVTVQPTAEGA